MESLSSKLKRKCEKSTWGGEAPAKRREAIKVEESGARCDFDFYDRPCEELAKKLLGCLLVSSTTEGDQDDSGAEQSAGEEARGRLGGERGGVEGDESWKCWGRIVETEAYLGGEDKASHSYNGKVTQRNQAMYMPPGTAYVYSIYGMHHCFNISSRGQGAAVLVRALEPLGGCERMRKCRKVARKERELCNGPAKLCQALGIDKTLNRLDLTCSEHLWLEVPMAGGDGSDIGVPSEVVTSARVGVAYAGEEWSEKPLRFYTRGSQYVSK